MAKPQPNLFGLRREAERHAALELHAASRKRCRRFALLPQSKIIAADRDRPRSRSRLCAHLCSLTSNRCRVLAVAARPHRRERAGCADRG